MSRKQIQKIRPEVIVPQPEPRRELDRTAVAVAVIQGTFTVFAKLLELAGKVIEGFVRVVTVMAESKAPPPPPRERQSPIIPILMPHLNPTAQRQPINWGLWLMAIPVCILAGLSYYNRHGIDVNKPTTTQLQARVEHCLEEIAFCEETHTYILSVRDELVSRAHKYDRAKKYGLPAFYRETSDSLERYTGPSPALLAGHKTALEKLKDGLRRGTFPRSDGTDALNEAESYVGYWAGEYRKAKELIGRLDYRTRGYR